MSKPVAGQWYVHDGDRCYGVWLTADGWFVHLPDCTGWDWQPETFPQWWTVHSYSAAFVRRDSPSRCVTVMKDGTENIWCKNWAECDQSSRTRLTEADALALLDPKPQPAEDPEEWVVLDPSQYADHTPRDGVDEFFNGRSWEVHDWKHCRTTVGEFAMVSDESRVRCRRKDLPPLPEPVATEADPWVAITDGQHALRDADEGNSVSNPSASDVAAVRGGWLNCKILGISGDAVSTQRRLRFRCRRSQLPQPKPTKRTVTVPKWLVILEGYTLVTEQSFEPTGKEVHRVGETTYTEQEDGSWRVN